ncbi:hypothetical protein [Pedobacter jeongneungensis]|uniref:hypothetical protein n=1 Tax=Pedobacter jeongneungensis TaxID=947309 RepID=UPI00046AD7E1|nr:hypothetical protein [Pedobacter jeongneungensis]
MKAEISKAPAGDFVYALSRIDRSVADNLKDIEKSFGHDAGMITDVIVFLTKRLNKNLFGFTCFTLNEFAKESGRNKQDLCEKHPVLKANPKLDAPEYFGHKFETVFDYALFQALQKNIIFSREYTTQQGSQTISLTNFPILKDIKLNVDRKSNAIKLYEIRVSDEFIQGALSRYYNIESNGYSMVGKGRGGDGRKRLFLFLYKTSHIVLSTNNTKTKLAVDYLASLAGIDVKEPRNRKTSLKRVLDAMVTKGMIPFTFTFTQGDNARKYDEDYYVELNFLKPLQEPSGHNSFKRNLWDLLKNQYKGLYSDTKYRDEKDPFQRWLNNPTVNLKEKAEAYQAAYYRSFSVNLTLSQAKQKVQEADLLS